MAETVYCGGCGTVLRFDGTWRTTKCEACRRLEWVAGLLARGMEQTARRLTPEDRHDHGTVTARLADACDGCGAVTTVAVALPRLWAKGEDLRAALAEVLPDACPRCGTSLHRVEAAAHERE